MYLQFNSLVSNLGSEVIRKNHILVLQDIIWAIGLQEYQLDCILAKILSIALTTSSHFFKLRASA